MPQFWFNDTDTGTKDLFHYWSTIDNFFEAIGTRIFILLDFTFPPFTLYVSSLVDVFPDMIELGLVQSFTNKNLP